MCLARTHILSIITKKHRQNHPCRQAEVISEIKIHTDYLK